MKRIIYNLIILNALFTFLSCGEVTKEADAIVQQNEDQRIKISKAQFKQNDMSLGYLEEKEFPSSIKVNGLIDVPPENRAVINAITGGYIKTIPLLVGDVVRKGQTMVTIENPEFVRMQQEYLEIKEQLNYLKTEFERQNAMFKEDIISQKTYLKAESQYKTANATYNGLKKQLSMLNINPATVEEGNITTVINIKAPISGNITKVNVSKGTYVSPTTSILEIIDNNHIHLELSVFEKDILNIKKGQKVLFNIPEASDSIYKAEVYLVGTSLQDDRTVKVHAHPLDESQSFLTGMFVNAQIITSTNTSLMALPENTVVESESDYYVLVLDEENDDTFYFKKIKINRGSILNGFAEIKNYDIFKETDEFLVNGAFRLIGN